MKTLSESLLDTEVKDADNAVNVVNVIRAYDTICALNASVPTSQGDIYIDRDTLIFKVPFRLANTKGINSNSLRKINTEFLNAIKDTGVKYLRINDFSSRFNEKKCVRLDLIHDFDFAGFPEIQTNFHVYLATSDKGHVNISNLKIFTLGDTYIESGISFKNTEIVANNLSLQNEWNDLVKLDGVKTNVSVIWYNFGIGTSELSNKIFSEILTTTKNKSLWPDISKEPDLTVFNGTGVSDPYKVLEIPNTVKAKQIYINSYLTTDVISVGKKSRVQRPCAELHHRTTPIYYMK